jgi:hypothetical protein
VLLVTVLCVPAYQIPTLVRPVIKILLLLYFVSLSSFFEFGQEVQFSQLIGIEIVSLFLFAT